MDLVDEVLTQWMERILDVFDIEDALVILDGVDYIMDIVIRVDQIEK